MHSQCLKPSSSLWPDVCTMMWCTVTSATLPCGSFPGFFFPQVTLEQSVTAWIDFYFQTVESSSLLDPCFHQGYQRIINISDFFKNPCTSDKKKELPFSQLYIEGVGDYQKCRENIQTLFNKTNCPYSSCSFNGIYLPPLHGDFGVSLHSFFNSL